MSELTFEKYPKTPRLSMEQMIITEKIDGTNAQVVFNEDGDILTGSRNRVIEPGDDNFGFAAWAHGNKDALFEVLGAGRHYGEWWGRGIQRGYGADRKYFSLFNTARWLHDDPDKLNAVEGLGVVPILYQGEFKTDDIEATMTALAATGSRLGPSEPEGICVYLPRSRAIFKRTYEYEETGKGENR